MRPSAIADRREVRVSVLATIFWGAFAVTFAEYANRLGSLIEAVNILGSLFYGTILGIFLTGFYLKHIGGTAVFLAALVAEVAVIACFKLTGISFLWYNVIGCAIVVVVSGAEPASRRRASIPRFRNQDGAGAGERRDAAGDELLELPPHVRRRSRALRLGQEDGEPAGDRRRATRRRAVTIPASSVARETMLAISLPAACGDPERRANLRDVVEPAADTAADEIAQRVHRPIGDPVIDRRALPSPRDEVLALEHAEVLGRVRKASAGAHGELRHGELAGVVKGVEEAEPRGVGEKAEASCCLVDELGGDGGHERMIL